jgi:hypothetical protein
MVKCNGWSQIRPPFPRKAGPHRHPSHPTHMLMSQCGKRWPLPNGQSGVLSGTCTTARRGIGDCCGAGESESDVGQLFLSAYSWVASRASSFSLPRCTIRPRCGLCNGIGVDPRNFLRKTDWDCYIAVTLSKGRRRYTPRSRLVKIRPSDCIFRDRKGAVG